MKKMVFVHGDKGGVGKSTFAGLLTDYAWNQGMPVALVEGDKMIRDVAPRFEGIEGVRVVDVNLARPDMSEDAIVALFGAMETHLGDTQIVIVNSPASSSETLDRQAEIIAPTVQALGYALLVAWMVDIGADSAVLAGKSELCRVADQKFAVQNTRLKPVEGLAWHRHPARREWLESGGQEVVLPGITERVMQKVREISDMPYSRMVRDPSVNLNIVERQSLKRWVENAWESACAPIILGEG